MKFRIKCRNINTKGEWWEDYDEDIEDVNQWAIDIIAFFNRTLRPGESVRELLEVEVLESTNEKFHDWHKHTAGMSVSFRGSMVDMMFCSKCHITGKRYGLGDKIVIDSKFKKKAYKECHTAQIEMNKE